MKNEVLSKLTTREEQGSVQHSKANQSEMRMTGTGPMRWKFLNQTSCA